MAVTHSGGNICAYLPFPQQTVTHGVTVCCGNGWEYSNSSKPTMIFSRTNIISKFSCVNDAKECKSYERKEHYAKNINPHLVPDVMCKLVDDTN